MQKILMFLIFKLIFNGNILANEGDTIKKPFVFGTKIHSGVLLPHSERIRQLAFNHPKGIELNFNWLNASDKSIRQLNCYSYTGLAINYIDFSHPKIGKSVNA